MPETLQRVMPLLILFALVMLLMAVANYKSLNIKSRTVGDGQHGSARFATPMEISKAFKRVKYEPQKWREGKLTRTVRKIKNKKIVEVEEPLPQGIIIGCEMFESRKWRKKQKKRITAIVDKGDVHALMIGAAGVGKTAKFLYPNLEYCCASGMSFVTTDTKGDLLRSYAPIAKKYYGYDISVLDLRNPTQSDGFNMLHMVNKYMDDYLKTNSLVSKAKAERYAKIISKTIINAGGFDSANAGQNAFFYDSAEGLVTAVILVIAEFCSPYTDKEQVGEQRHIVSVFKMIQDLIGPSEVKGKSKFKVLMEKLPEEHKARWLSGAALNTSDQAMASVLSTALSRLNAFLDSEIEQLLCFETKIDTEKFCKTKSAIFLIMPEEDDSKYFLISLIVQQLYREMLSIADEFQGKLPNRVMFFLDEFGTLPAIQSAEMMFSASRSRRISFVPIIQSLAQLEKNYGKEGADIIIDNCQICIYGGFAPNSEAAEVLSKILGDRTVMTGSISRGKDKSKSLQMTGRPLMSPDELKIMPKDTFIVTRTGVKPMKTKLKLFFEWGIHLEEEYTPREGTVRQVCYANKHSIERKIDAKYGRRMQPAVIEEQKATKEAFKNISQNMRVEEDENDK